MVCTGISVISKTLKWHPYDAGPMRFASELHCLVHALFVLYVVQLDNNGVNF